LQLDFTKPATTQINTLLDLVGAKVQIPGVNNAPGQTVESPWKADASSYQKLMKLYDSAMAGGAQRDSDPGHEIGSATPYSAHVGLNAELEL
jgi:hypothetical protein